MATTSAEPTAGCLAPAASIVLYLGCLVVRPHQASGCLEFFDEIASICRGFGGFELLELPERLRPMAVAPSMRAAFLFPDGIRPLTAPIIPITTH